MGGLLRIVQPLPVQILIFCRVDEPHLRRTVGGAGILRRPTDLSTHCLWFVKDFDAKLSISISFFC